nr:hypothetical protein GCM10020241_53910 [Streptoalloteichus tenebrarius]
MLAAALVRRDPPRHLVQPGQHLAVVGKVVSATPGDGEDLGDGVLHHVGLETSAQIAGYGVVVLPVESIETVLWGRQSFSSLSHRSCPAAPGRHRAIRVSYTQPWRVVGRGEPDRSGLGGDRTTVTGVGAWPRVVGSHQVINAFLGKPRPRRLVAGPARPARTVEDPARAAAVGWTADGGGQRVLARVIVKDDAIGGPGWIVIVDSSIVRAHHHTAGARKRGRRRDRSPRCQWGRAWPVPAAG